MTIAVGSVGVHWLIGKTRISISDDHKSLATKYVAVPVNDDDIVVNYCAKKQINWRQICVTTTCTVWLP